MKKTYVKPEVYFENFELSANIAAGCGAGYKDKVTSHDIHTCGYIYNSGVIFNTGVCSYETADGTEYGLCYHSPMPDNQIFAS